MSGWIEYTGTDEQVEEMRNAEHGFVVRYSDGEESGLRDKEHISYNDSLDLVFDFVTHYLICNPHPLADMIERQTRTGQPVYIDRPHTFREYERVRYVTTTPNWDIPGAEYSFTPFEEGK